MLTIGVFNLLMQLSVILNIPQETSGRVKNRERDIKLCSSITQCDMEAMFLIPSRSTYIDLLKLFHLADPRNKVNMSFLCHY